MNDLIAKYMQAKINLDKYKELERELRLEVIQQTFPSANIGNFKAEIDGLKLTANLGLSHRIDNSALAEITSVLSAEELDCIVYKPSLTLSKYKALDDSQRKTLDEAIITKPSLPTLKIETLEN